MDLMDIFDKTFDLYDELVTSELYVKVKESLKDLLEDKESKNLIDNFNEAKIKYQESCKYGDYYPNRDQIKKSFVSAKSTLYTNKLYLEYKKNLDNFNNQLNEIGSSINEAIFGKDLL